ncbi:MAG TPA: Crp/Fnr family transcriptional regulator [Conexibacter sp.]|nr:Crp/Fnr family transcriptional regulator [Conexibacter sp.]
MTSGVRAAAGDGRHPTPTADGRDVQVLRVDRELGDMLGPVERARAEAAARARAIDVRAGRWDVPLAPDRFRGWLGLLMVRGLLARHVEIGAMGWTELLGPGDLLQPWTHVSETASTLPAEARYEVIEPARMAVLDRAFALRVAPWPEIAAALLARSIERTRWLTYHLAAGQPARIDERAWMALWHLADRFGRVTPRGVELVLSGLTHEVLAVMLGARRPTVSSALRRLVELGLVTQPRRGEWLLHGEPSAGLARIAAAAPSAAV